MIDFSPAREGGEQCDRQSRASPEASETTANLMHNCSAATFLQKNMPTQGRAWHRARRSIRAAPPMPDLLRLRPSSPSCAFLRRRLPPREQPARKRLRQRRPVPQTLPDRPCHRIVCCAATTADLSAVAGDPRSTTETSSPAREPGRALGRLNRWHEAYKDRRFVKLPSPSTTRRWWRRASAAR